MNRALPNTLAERIARLKSLHDLKAPPSILCTEVLLVLKATFAVHPVEMGTVFASWASCVAQAEVGICPECDSPRVHEMHVCDRCIEGADEDDPPNGDEPDIAGGR
jgi:hypothetical protein